jgi:hypothetical protein
LANLCVGQGDADHELVLGEAGNPAEDNIDTINRNVNKGEVRSRIQGFMRKLLHLPEHVMSYFQHPSVQYAAAINL